MALSNNTQNILNTQYFDDWYAAGNSAVDPELTRGEQKDFQRILFRPKYAVQSRELTQVQTILQAQLERFGKSAFLNGEAVTGGELTLDNSVIAGKVLPSTNLVAFFDVSQNLGKYVFDSANNTIKAHILQFASIDEGFSDNYLIFKYLSSATFSPATVIQATDDAAITATFASDIPANVFENGSIISINEGIFFVSGFFIRVPAQTIVLDPFTQNPSFRIGLEITEEIIDELDDTTLLDPANQNAPGAHRFKISAVLSKRSLSVPGDSNFLELCQVINGVIQKTQTTPRYVRMDELNAILARRTYDEAGDYLVRPFTPVIQKDPSAEDHFVLSLGPGKAYVRGFEVETTEPTLLELRKGRTSANVVDRSIPARVGNFVYATRVGATQPDNYFSNTGVVDIHCVNIASILTTSSATYNYSRIGQAKVRMLETFSVPANTALQANNTVYKLFFYDVTYDSLAGNLTTSAANALAITLQTPVGNGFPIVNGAIEGATIILGGNQSPVTGTFTVNNYVTNTTVAFITLKEFLPTLPNGNTTYKLLFQPKDIDSFALFDSSVTTSLAPLAADLKFQADVDPTSKISGTPVGDTIVSDTNTNTLIYQIPEKFVVSNTITTNSAIFTTWLQTTANARTLSATNTTFTISISGAAYSLPTGNLSATSAEENLIIFDQTADANGRGRILQFTDTPASSRCISNVSIAQVGTTYNITFTAFNLDNLTTRSLTGLAKTTVIGLAPRQKTLIMGNTTNAISNTTGALNGGQIEFYSLNATAGFAYSLKTADVFQIAKVLYKSSNTAFVDADLATATDVTNLFTLDTGQRDNSYDYSRLIAGIDASSVVRPTGRLLVIFNWFKHSGQGYITLDSYLSSTNIANGLTYDTIPDYVSTKLGRTPINLRSAIDFRPTQSNFDFIASALVFPANDAGANTTYLTSTGLAYLTPVSDENWLGNYSYFLSRYDKIALGFDGVFHVIEGVDAVSPTIPNDTVNSLMLFQLYIPAYTLVDANGVPTTVVLTTFGHKGFTMQEISKIEDRVSHLEYYTALNSLEQITTNQSITDADGNERFKNGIVVDNFHGTDVADVSRTDYTASIDTMNMELHTAFRSFVLSFAPDIANSTSFGVTLIGDMAIPTYNTAPFVTQGLATHAISVNPFDVASFYGSVKLLPAVDIWKDTSVGPAQVIDIGGASDSWNNNDLPSFVNWGEWDQTWSGTTGVQTQRSYSTPPGWTPDNHAFRSETELSWDDVTTATTYQRQGVQYELQVTPTTQSIGNQVVDVSVIHFCRERDVVFTGTGLKPNSNIFFFFDGTDVLNRIQQADVLQLTPLSAPTGNTPALPLYIGQTVYVQKAVSGQVAIASGNTQVLGNANCVFQFEAITGGLVRVQQGVTSFDSYVANIASNTALTLSTAPGVTLSNATLYTLTPVTIADFTTRITGNTVTYTVKVVRAVRDADVDTAVPYPIVAGSLRPDKQVNDGANTTTGATLLTFATPRNYAVELPYGVNVSTLSQSINITSALCVSGVVRSWNAGTGQLRFDTDILDSVVSTPGTRVYLVAGPGAGTSANISSYNAATQTATLDNSTLGIVAEQTIYSVGQPATDGFITGNTTSGRAGTIAGVFHMPGATFAVGTRTFRLTDNANNVANDATTGADANYEASGLSTTQQAVSVTSRQLGLVRLGPTSESFTIQQTAPTNFQSQYVDPLAETFLVDAQQFPQGIFITSVDLCFATVPDDDIPVTVQIRPVVNGYPSSNQLVPCVAPEGVAIATLRPDQVITTNTPSFTTSPTTFTRFTFPAPVQLLPGASYALVIMSDSDQYTVYTAELGQTMIGQTAIVSKQPYAGSFFKSQNAQTWTESPFEDLMFQINRAVWSATNATPQTGALVARAIAPDANTLFDSIEFYPHDVQFTTFTTATYNLDIKPWNSTTNDLTGEVAVRYTVVPNTWQPLSTRSMIQGSGGSIAANSIGESSRPLPLSSVPTINYANTITATAILSTTSTDVAPFLDLKKLNVLCVRHDINNMDLVVGNIQVTNPGAGYLANLQSGTVATTGGSPTVTGTSTSFTTLLTVGDTVVIGGNLTVVVASVTNTTQFVATANVAVSRSANTWYRYGGIGANNNLPLTITGGDGTTANGYATIGSDGAVSFVTLTTNGSGYIETPTVTIAAPVAPGGDYTLTQTTALFVYNSELATSGGNGLTRYIIRPVTLADGFDARDITVYFDAYRPAGSHFHVYYKVLGGDTNADLFDDQPWRLMTQSTDDSVVSTSYNQFKEFSFVTPNGRALDSTTDTSDKFKIFAVKVVMATDNTVDPPRITNFRAIALDA